jgi:disulfide bond formation protein DsbB
VLGKSLFAKILKILEVRNTILTLLFMSVFAFLSSTFAELIYHKAPCDLCLVSRALYGVIAILSCCFLKPTKLTVVIIEATIICYFIVTKSHVITIVNSLILLAVLLIFCTLKRNNQLLKSFLVFAVLASTFFAFFHLGVENHWWVGPAKCTTALLPTLDQVMDNSQTARCDVVNWSIFGISSTLYNLCITVLLSWLITISMILEYTKKELKH